MERRTGEYAPVSTVGEVVQAFVPSALPPRPPLVLRPADQQLIEEANRAVGRLDFVTSLLPNAALLIYGYVRKEALMSSQIEGTQSSFADLLLYESDQAPGVPIEDVREVCDYIAALGHGVNRIRDGFPVSGRLLREVHEILLRTGRGADKRPGEFRKSQVWLGGTRPGNARFVPPPANRLAECMGALEKFVHDEPVETPTLIKAALAHVHFDTIHPFLDGNGRLGRLLITLLLCAEGALTEPLLYLSLYFKQNRQEYYERLQRVRLRGDWEGWVRFFVRGVLETAGEGLATAKRVLALVEKDRLAVAGLGRTAHSALKLHAYLLRRPVTGIREVERTLKMSYPTAAATLQKMKKLGLVKELTGFKRNRVFAYGPYIDILAEGTEPL